MQKFYHIVGITSMIAEITSYLVRTKSKKVEQNQNKSALKKKKKKVPLSLEFSIVFQTQQEVHCFLQILHINEFSLWISVLGLKISFKKENPNVVLLSPMLTYLDHHSESHTPYLSFTSHLPFFLLSCLSYLLLSLQHFSPSFNPGNYQNQSIASRK